jgi:DNA primase
MSAIMDNRDQIEEIKNKLDIFQVVQQYVPSLKKSGRNYFGLCPFHKEKTPSFSVSPELGLYKCFGCGEGGDVLKFIEKIEGLDFPKTLELAARRAGVTLKRQFSPERSKLRAEKDKLTGVNKLVSEYYNYVLLKHPSGKPGMDYSVKRKLGKKVLEQFVIGYAPRAYYNILNFLQKRGYTRDEIIKWGLAVNREGKVFDKFRDRLVFPIQNAVGDFVGFSARTISAENMGPKYLNSPETIVYKKSEILYGLFQAKEHIRKEDFVIIVEGNIDILSSHQAGVGNIVAPMGTALTVEQLKLIKRYTNKIYFALDTDMAGQKALLKALDLCEKEGMISYILDLELYTDVDELITSGGDWKQKVKEPREFVLYFIEKLQKNYDFSKPAEKSQYAMSILKLIHTVSDHIVQSDYIQKLSDVTNINPDILINELGKMAKISKEVYIPQQQSMIIDTRLNEIDMLTRYLLALIANFESWSAKIIKENIESFFYNQEYKNVFQAILNSKLRDSLSRVEFEMFSEVSLMRTGDFESFDDFQKEFHQVANRLKKELIKNKIAHIKFRIKTGKGDEEELMKEVKTELKELAQLK